MHAASDTATDLAGGRLTVDLGALAANWRSVAERVGPKVEASAVIKADGYGLGIVAVARALAAAGCRTFFVAVASEGIAVRAAVPDAVIYVLAGLLPGTAAAHAAHDLRPVLSSRAEVDEWAAAKRAGMPTNSAIHIDTGMNRLGLSMDEANALAADRDLVAAVSPSLLMSHLACSDEPEHPMNRTQVERFRSVRALFPGIPASLANSGGVLLGPDWHFDMVRPGIALYGGDIVAGVRTPMRPVVTLEGRVLLVRDAKVGETAGYGATRTFDRPTRLAVLGLGYADGFHRITGRAGSGSARAFIRGSSAPFAGRVSMDLITIDVTDIPGVARGDWAELFGPNLPIDEAASHAGTIGYEFLTGLGRRYPRRYVV